VIAFLGYDPFIASELGRPKGNETPFVAIFSSNEPETIGLAIRKHRMELKKNRKECAKELGVDVKTLRAWETDRQTPGSRFQELIVKFLESRRSRPKQ